MRYSGMPSPRSICAMRIVFRLLPRSPTYRASVLTAARRQCESSLWPRVATITNEFQPIGIVSIALTMSMFTTSLAPGNRSRFANSGRSSITVTS